MTVTMVQIRTEV